ncbi:MAG: UbiA prenyltransferase family protein [Pirellulales bacterium]|nr:UbiA prenyltransferase family protein [Pirellulales bacterium]
MSQSSHPSVTDASAGTGQARYLFVGAAIRRILRCLACVRYRDPAKVLTPTVIGLGCVVESPLTYKTYSTMLLLIFGGYVLMAHCLAMNDWTDGTADSRDPRKINKAFLNREVTRTEMLILTIALGIISLWIIGTAAYHLLPLAVMIMACSLVYSFPHSRLEGKQIPFLSTLMHVVTAVLMFLLGYCLWSGVDLRGVMIGTYFGLIYEAGHLILEVKDFEGDRNSGVRTYAVRFGQRPVFMAACMVTLAAGMLLGGLALTGYLPYSIAFVALLYLPILFMFWRLRNANFTHRTARTFSKKFVNIHTIIWGLILVINIFERLD